MSIVFCQACGKKISDKVKLCGHCGFQRGEVSNSGFSFDGGITKENINVFMSANYNNFKCI